MYEFMRLETFVQLLFDRETEACKAARILAAILQARSPRLSDISHRMLGRADANYKQIQRFLETSEPQVALQRLYWEASEFILADPTRIARPQARRTEYVGVLSDGETRGY